MRRLLSLLAAVALVLAVPAATVAGPFSQLICSVTAEKSPVNMSLASWSVDEANLAYSNRVQKPWKSDLFSPGAPSALPDLIRVAGKCGSSGYSCTSPGFLYCCGNSTDGFYCAADVNGC
ncbi:MAG: hypothetical protein ACTSY1_04585 [Alphaproteobacteria bacterium]